jgi:hypothetical protein
MLESLLVEALKGFAVGAASGAAEVSALAQGNKIMVGHLRRQAIPRIGVWLALALWSLVRTKNLITGEGRDIAFRDMTLSTANQAAAIAITLGAGALCVLAAWRTYKVERTPPAPGVLWFPGYRLPLFGEWLLAIVGGLLLLVGLWALSGVPEAFAAGNDERYHNYTSAGATPQLVLGGFMGAMGWLCMIFRRSRWELVPGQPLIRRAITAFSRPRPMGQQLELEWEDYWIGNGVMRRQVAWVLRGVVRKGKAFEISFAPLQSTVDQRAAIAEGWRRVIDTTGSVTASV